MAYMDRVNRFLVGNNNGEILNQFNWDIQFNKWPEVVYNPGEDLFKTRLISLGSMPSDVSHDVQNVEVAGNFSVIQTGAVQRDPFDLSMEFQDYEDSSIAYFARDWTRKCEDPVTKFGYPKSQLIMDITVLQLTNARVPIKGWKFYTGMISSYNTNENFGRTKEVNGKVTITIRFEWWDDYFLNQ